MMATPTSHPPRGALPVRRFLLLLGTACLTATPAAAQKDAKIPKRPELFAGADTNSWFVYYQTGLQNLRRRPDLAADDFYWAERLNPAAPEPLYAGWVAFWKKRPDRFWDYLAGKKFIVENKEVQRIDSLRLKALQRNPMMYQGLWLELFEDEAPLNMSLDPATQGLVAYAHGNPARAAERLGQAVKSRENRSLRYDRALALYQMAQYDTAANELQILLDDMKKREEKKLVRAYESKQMFEFGIAILMIAKGDTAAARDALGKALTEDLAFAPAHIELAHLAAASGDTATAVQELSQAVELDSTDVIAHYELGVHLMMQNHTDEAQAQLRKAIALEPYFAQPYFPLAYLLEYDEKNAEAAEMYLAFAARATRADEQRATVARAQAAVLQKRAGTTP
jgi:tetratricopeptide (TPR) repeat protein